MHWDHLNDKHGSRSLKLSWKRRVLSANHSPSHFRPLPRPLKCFPSTSAKCLLCRHFAALPSAAPILKHSQAEILQTTTFQAPAWNLHPPFKPFKEYSKAFNLHQHGKESLIFNEWNQSRRTSWPAGLKLVAYFQVKPGRGELELFLEATSPATPTPTSPPPRA